MDVASLRVRVSADTRDAESGLKRVSGLMRDMVGTAGGFLLAGGIQAMGRGVRDLVGGMIGANAQAETWRNSLNIAVGDLQEAGEIFTFLQKFAAETPFEFPELVQAAVRLEGFGVTAVDVIDLLGNTAAAMNRDLMQITEAYLDAGVGQYRRLQELGIDVTDLGDEVMLRWFENGKMMEKTIADTGEAVQAEVASIWSKYDGAMETQSKTFQGRMSTFKDNWRLLTMELGAGLFEFASRGLEIANEWFTVFGEIREGGVDPLRAAFMALRRVLTPGTDELNRWARMVNTVERATFGAIRGFREMMDIAGRLREAIGVNGFSGALAIASIELNRFLPPSLVSGLIRVSDLIGTLAGNLIGVGGALFRGDFSGA